MDKQKLDEFMKKTMKENNTNLKVPKRSGASSKSKENFYTYIDLFAGIGGFSYGFNLTKRFKNLLGVDIWNVALDTYQKNQKNSKVLCGDIQKLDDNFWKKYNPDILIAGPPCQGFSMSGKRSQEDPRNLLFLEVIRVANITQPQIVIIENVVGLLSMKNLSGKLFIDYIKDEFNNIGYRIDYKVVNSSEYGVPQNRRRLIIVASKDLKITFPEAEFGENKLPFISVGDAFGNIESYSYLEPQNEFQKIMSDTTELTNHEPIEHSNIVTKRMATVPQGGNWEDIPKELGQGGGKHSNNYRRLKWNEPSITIKHVSKSMMIHPKYNRVPTVREIARIQSFPDSFVFLGTKYEQYQQLANAVPPLLGKALAKQVLKMLESKNA